MNVYDFDKTIYKGDSTIDFYIFSVSKKIQIIRYLPEQIKGLFLYKFGKIEKTEMKEKFFLFLADFDNPEEIVSQFWKKKQSKISSWYLQQKRKSDVIISASPSFLLRPICDILGTEHLIASEVDIKTGLFHGKNCYGTEKLRRFYETFGNTQIEKFYSDSCSDTPLAEIAEEAFLIRNGKISPWYVPSDFKNIKHQILRFGIVGVIATMIDYGLMVLMTDVAGIPYFISCAVSFSISVLVNYILSVTFVFAVSENQSTTKKVIVFFLLSVIGLLLNQLMMCLLVERVYINYKAAKIIATGIVMVYNYISRKLFLEGNRL